MFLWYFFVFLSFVGCFYLLALFSPTSWRWWCSYAVFGCNGPLTENACAWTLYHLRDGDGYISCHLCKRLLWCECRCVCVNRYKPNLPVKWVWTWKQFQCFLRGVLQQQPEYSRLGTNDLRGLSIIFLGQLKKEKINIFGDSVDISQRFIVKMTHTSV